MAEEQKQGMVQDQCMGLSMSIDDLGRVVGVLCERLEPVLREETRTDNTKPEVQPILCPLAAQIHAYEGRVRNLTGALQDLIDRLEV